jgi:hypothetical protein
MANISPKCLVACSRRRKRRKRSKKIRKRVQNKFQRILILKPQMSKWENLGPRRCLINLENLGPGRLKLMLLFKIIKKISADTGSTFLTASLAREVFATRLKMSNGSLRKSYQRSKSLY